MINWLISTRIKHARPDHIKERIQQKVLYSKRNRCFKMPLIYNEKAVEDDFRMDHYLTFQVNMLKCLGMWPLNFKRFLPRSLHSLNFGLNAAFYLLMSGNLLQMAVLQIKTLVDAWNGSNMDDVSDFIISSIIYSAGFAMCLYFQVRYRANKRMVDHLNRTLVSRSSRGLTFVTVIPGYKWARKLSIWWSILCVLGTIHYGIYPLLVSKRILPVNIRYPFDTQESPTFEIMYFVQFFGQLQIGAIYSVYGNMWMSVIILICGQFDVLFCSVKNALWAAVIQRGEPDALSYLKQLQSEEDLALANTFSEYYLNVEEKDSIPCGISNQYSPKKSASTRNTGYDAEILQQLRKVVRLHQNILRLSAMLEEFFYPFLLGKLFVCSLLACFLAYLSSSGVTSPMKVVTLLEYLFLVFAELLLITYFPTILLHQVSELKMEIQICMITTLFMFAEHQIARGHH